MSADTAIFLQTALQEVGLLPENEDMRQEVGDWRIFSKMGAGYSTSRGRGEIISSAYGCIPNPRDDEQGLEITITCRGSVKRDFSLVHVQKKVKDAISEAIEFAKQSF